MFVDPHVDWPVILDYQREGRTAAGDDNIFLGDRNCEVARSLKDLAAQKIGGFARTLCESHFLVDEIAELERSEIGRQVLSSSEQQRNQNEQKEELSAAQAKHDAKL